MRQSLEHFDQIGLGVVCGGHRRAATVTMMWAGRPRSLIEATCRRSMGLGEMRLTEMGLNRITKG